MGGCFPVVDESLQDELQRPPQPSLTEKREDGDDEGQGQAGEDERHWVRS